MKTLLSNTWDRIGYKHDGQLSSQPVHTLLSRILSFPCSVADDDAVQGRIRAEQISNIKRYLSAMMLANVCNAGILIVALWASPQHQLAIIWANHNSCFHTLSRLQEPSFV